MNDLEKSIKLYETIIQRLDDTLAPRQKEKYKETLVLIKESTDIKDAQRRIKNSPLYTAIGQALIMDKLLAQQKAMEFVGLKDVAELYENRIKELEADQFIQAYSTAFTKKIQEALSQHLEIMATFSNIIIATIQLRSATASDTTMIESHKSDIKKHLGHIREFEESFHCICSKDIYRNATGIADDKLDSFIQLILSVEDGTYETPQYNIDEEAESVFNYIKEYKKDVIDASGKETWGASECIAVPDEHEEYGYMFIDYESEAI